MKKSILLLSFVCSGVFLGCSSDNSSENPINNENNKTFVVKGIDCPDGMTYVLTWELVSHRLHRASKGCLEGFSICGVYELWGRCEENEAIPDKAITYDTTTRVTTFVGQKISGENKLLLRFPKGLLTDPSFKRSDFEVFAFDEDYQFDIYTAKAGEYTPEITDTEIQVTVDLL